MLVLIGIGLAAGFITAISPCVLPVLPIVFAGGATGGRRKPFAIIAGLVLSFSAFTLFGVWLLRTLGLPEDLLRDIAIALLFLVAATLLFPKVEEVVQRPFLRLTRQALGVVVGLTALAIAFNVDRHFQTALPGYTEALQNKVEESNGAQRQLQKLRGNTREVAATTSLRDYGPAPELTGLTNWTNSKPLTLRQLRGKVVLIDFWTYSCINCLRTLPHVKAWYHTYHDKGLVVIGVHTPEFAFEHVPNNVRSAVRRLGVRYPVALDNDYGTWNVFQNQYWPAKYLIDRGGHLRYYHFGEGSYDTTEARIRTLLGENGGMLPVANELSDPTPTGLMTPESYLGYERLARFAQKTITPDRFATYHLPASDLRPNELAYGGRWKVEGERIVAGPGAQLRLRFQARSVHLVLGGRGTVAVIVDGKPVGVVPVRGSRLYTLAKLPTDQSRLLELHFSPGVEAYAFTFG
jgi:thiol-disulfide isomerase/thioredoxin